MARRMFDRGSVDQPARQLRGPRIARPRPTQLRGTISVAVVDMKVATMLLRRLHLVERAALHHGNRIADKVVQRHGR